ncbi:MAG TPA: hypothetical protein VJY35_14230 [Candidatus Eisenbacteria bacterium]|nr:hypothetical protein [Candidatus Eisenbacteria bacterium]
MTAPAHGAVRSVRLAVTALLVGLGSIGAGRAVADDSLAAGPARPFVRGGYDDKPHIAGLFGRIAVGGYLEARAGWTRQDGVTDELGIEVTRWNLLVSTRIRERVDIFSEIEFEDGGGETTVELAQVDVRLVPAFNTRAGVLLLPLGRFNLAHDAPRNEMITRPAEAEELLGVALAQPGLGAFGRIDRPGGARLTYEAYAVTGYHHGLLADAPGGTRLSAGKRNFEDANASPGVVARVEWSPHHRAALGLSGYHGAYNLYRLDGLAVDERRDVAVAVIDFEAPTGPIQWSGEAAAVRVDLPPTLAGLFAGRQAGAYLMGAWRFGETWIAGMPGSSFTLAARVEAVDFDRDLSGDSMRALGLGLNFRPIPETVLKLGFERGETRDRFNNLGAFARIRLGVASYF